MHLHQVLTGAVNPGDNCYSVGSVEDIPFTVMVAVREKRRPGWGKGRAFGRPEERGGRGWRGLTCRGERGGTAWVVCGLMDRGGQGSDNEQGPGGGREPACSWVGCGGSAAPRHSGTKGRGQTGVTPPRRGAGADALRRTLAARFSRGTAADRGWSQWSYVFPLASARWILCIGAGSLGSPQTVHPQILLCAFYPGRCMWVCGLPAKSK